MIVLDLIFNEFFLIFILILANGFFSAAELAVLSARKTHIASLAAAGNPNARLVEQIQKNPHRFLATVQIGVTVVGSFASAIGGAAAIEYLKPVLQRAPFDIIRHAADPLSIALVVIGIVMIGVFDI